MRARNRFIRTGVLTAAGLIALTSFAPVASARPTALPDIPDLSTQYWFGNMRIAQIWKLGDTGQGITVAVLDTGVQASETDLKGVVLPGSDLLTGDGRTDTDTDNGHGTSMARFIAGQGGGALDLTGIAPSAKILPVTVDNELVAIDFKAQVAKGIRYAVDHRARIISLSQASTGVAYPGNCAPEVADAVRYAIGKGAVVVAGAGNDGDTGNDPKYPAACPGVLAVGAVDGSKRPWKGTERQNYVDVASAGVDMATKTLNGDPAHSDGTSNATALVSGALALVWSKLPQLTNRQVVARLLATVTDDAVTPGKDTATGYGIVRPYFAITRKIPADAPNPVFDEIAASTPSTTPGATTTPSAAGGPRAGGGASHSDTPVALYLGIGGAAVVVLATLAFVVARGRRRPPGGGPGPWAGPPPGPPASGW